jgi:5'-3' exonuclease
MQYFINKITEDLNWWDIVVVFSGHKVPGEGKHKIMEYIQLSRAQPDYDPNIRCCLYRFDTDLIMLWLLCKSQSTFLLVEGGGQVWAIVEGEGQELYVHFVVPSLIPVLYLILFQI